MKEERNLLWSETDGTNLIDWIRCRPSDEGLEDRFSIERYDSSDKLFLISIGEKEFYFNVEEIEKVVNFINKVK